MILGDSGPAWKERVISYTKVLVTASAVTILNPYGLDLPRHLFQFFGKQYLFDNTAEFTSPDFHEAAGKIFLAVLLLCLTSLVLCARRPNLPRLFTLLAGTAFALISVRNIPLFGLTALPLLAIHLDPDWRRFPDPRGFRHRFAITAGRTSTWPWVLSILALLCLLGAFRGRIGSTRLLSEGFDGSTFPVAAVRHARAERLKAASSPSLPGVDMSCTPGPSRRSSSTEAPISSARSSFASTPPSNGWCRAGAGCSANGICH